MAQTVAGGVRGRQAAPLAWATAKAARAIEGGAEGATLLGEDAMAMARRAAACGPSSRRTAVVKARAAESEASCRMRGWRGAAREAPRKAEAVKAAVAAAVIAAVRAVVWRVAAQAGTKWGWILRGWRMRTMAAGVMAVAARTMAAGVMAVAARTAVAVCVAVVGRMAVAVGIAEAVRIAEATRRERIDHEYESSPS